MLPKCSSVLFLGFQTDEIVNITIKQIYKMPCAANFLLKTDDIKAKKLD